MPKKEARVLSFFVCSFFFSFFRVKSSKNLHVSEFNVRKASTEYYQKAKNMGMWLRFVLVRIQPGNYLAFSQIDDNYLNILALTTLHVFLKIPWSIIYVMRPSRHFYFILRSNGVTPTSMMNLGKGNINITAAVIGVADYWWCIWIWSTLYFV